MRRAVLALGVVLTSLTFAAAASADPMPVTSVYPEDGATYSLPSGSIAFQLTSPVLHMIDMYVEVATQKAPLGQMGRSPTTSKRTSSYWERATRTPEPIRAGRTTFRTGPGGRARLARTTGRLSLTTTQPAVDDEALREPHLQLHAR